MIEKAMPYVFPEALKVSWSERLPALYVPEISANLQSCGSVGVKDDVGYITLQRTTSSGCRCEGGPAKGGRHRSTPSRCPGPTTSLAARSALAQPLAPVKPVELIEH